MKIGVLCEFSGVVRDAFIARGHDAVSCDLLPTEAPGPHIQGDCLAQDWSGFDLLICHPPCTYLTWAGAGSWNDPGRSEKRENALRFFVALWNLPAPRLAIENPRGYPDKAFRRHSQEVNPFNFGDPHRKRVCLWLRGLPPLMHTTKVHVYPDKTYLKSNGRKYNCYFHQGKNGHARSRFFPGIARAMAEQWTTPKEPPHAP